MSKIVDIIKYEGDNNTFVWKHPCEDFNALSQLIVHESQEAIFFMNGQATVSAAVPSTFQYPGDRLWKYLPDEVLHLQRHNGCHRGR